MLTADMDSALEAIQFFANSANRVRIFEALADGATTGHTLAERTGASRSTVARILGEGESRGWIDSEGSQYELTRVGSIMIEEFRAYLQTVQGVQHLGEAVYWLPPPARALEFRHLRDAEVITPTATRPARPSDHVADRLRTANELRTLAPTGVPRLTKLCAEQSDTGQLDVRAVISAGFFNTLATDPEVVTHWRALAEREDISAYDGRVPIGLHVIDNTVIIWLTELRGETVEVRGVLVSESPAVLSWAESLFEEYRTEAEPVDPAALPVE